MGRSLAVLGVPGVLGGGATFGAGAEIYGVSWDGSSDPTLTRIGDAVGLVANAGVDDQVVANDFDNIWPWSAMQEVTDAAGNVYIDIPPFYIRATADGAARTWEISRTPHGADWYLPRCFWDFNTNRPCHLQVGKYTASLSADSKLESKPGTYPLVYKNIVDMRGYAQANGAGYQQLDVHAMHVLQVLFWVEFATLHSQSVMAGFTSGRYTNQDLAAITETGTNRIVVDNATAAYYRVGQAISVGTSQGGNQVFYGRTIEDIVVYDASNMAIEFDGDPVDITAGNYLYNTGWRNDFSGWIAASSGSLASNSDGKYPCVYRGIENPWGSVWQFVDGVNINDYQAWVCANADDYASNLFAAPYEQLSYTNRNANGYTTAMGHDPAHPYAALPTAVGGGVSTYYADYYYQAAGQRIALVGGSWRYGSHAGLSCRVLSDASSDARLDVGARLCRKVLS